MGNRANICMEYENGEKIFFYTHWQGSQLPKILQNALKRGKDRWDDEHYLARIIFSEMIQDTVLEETGYGISPYITDNQHPIIVVNCTTQIVALMNYNWPIGGKLNLTDKLYKWKFNKYITTPIEDIMVHYEN